MIYTGNNVLSRHWDRDLLFGVDNFCNVTHSYKVYVNVSNIYVKNG